jgi:hypothetical protein
MNSKGTPGPWVVEIHKTEYPDIFRYNVMAPKGWREDTGKYSKCSVATGLDCPHDAALIAAAPDMLAALKAMVAERPTKEPPAEAGIAHRNWELFEQARAAIAKAEGRS